MSIFTPNSSRLSLMGLPVGTFLSKISTNLVVACSQLLYFRLSGNTTKYTCFYLIVLTRMSSFMSNSSGISLTVLSIYIFLPKISTHFVVSCSQLQHVDHPVVQPNTPACICHFSHLNVYMSIATPNSLYMLRITYAY